MIRFVAVFAALFVGAAACLTLLPNPPKVEAKPSPVATELRADAQPAATARSEVRVVYPALGTQAASVQSATASAAAPQNPVATEGAALPGIGPQAASAAVADAAMARPDADTPAGAPGLNLNTASVEALNQIPGAGRIGRTIASHRPYRSVEDLLAKRVVRKSVYDRIKDQVAAE